MAQEENLIVKLTFEFAVNVLDVTEALEVKHRYALANQLTKSGTSIGANVRESQSCESRADFIHKMKIAAKEAEETDYWLDLLAAKKYYDTSEHKNQLLSIMKVLSKIIASAHRGK